MKKKYYILTAVISYFVILIATIPAKPVTDIFSDDAVLAIQGVSGTIWNGKAYLISANNMQFKKTNWSFNLWKLLIGKLSIDASTTFLNNKITTELGISFLGTYFANDLSTKIAAKEVAQLANIPLVQLDGMISLNIEHAQWKQGESPLATGEILWSNATVTVADTVPLGNISIVLGESEQELLSAEIKNQGGSININGTAELISEADYAVNIKLLPTATTNDNIKQSLGLFAAKQSNGEYLFKQSGSLDDIM
ncbi:hypothetical protein MNBD_GAMMA06-671 [hydrothermal vent metagenome]|uniref:General secretion pathway protein N n=1 Tax=hydrothermal vent metagenome TaxID=652676 RepID=A0A3B0WGD2_9ZZZZ